MTDEVRNWLLCLEAGVLAAAVFLVAWSFVQGLCRGDKDDEVEQVWEDDS